MIFISEERRKELYDSITKELEYSYRETITQLQKENEELRYELEIHRRIYSKLKINIDVETKNE